jgi:DNA/RNA-binding domain of Phe-tRNA-synthetase-like protein
MVSSDVMKPIIGYDPEIPGRFPQLSWACILIEGVSNEPSPMALTAKMRLAELEVRAVLQSTPIAEIPTVVAWRRVFSSFGAKPTKYRNSLEALLRRISKGEALPSISYLVDLGNLVSISCRVPLGIFDVDRFAAPAKIGFAMNTSPTLGRTKPITQKWERWCSPTPMAS